MNMQMTTHLARAFPTGTNSFPGGMQLSRCTAPFVVDFQIFLMFIFSDPTVLKTCLLIPLWTKIHTSA